MKKKYLAITLAVIGVILVCLSVVLAYNAMNDMHLIGGADWPTFKFVFSRGNGGLYAALAGVGCIAVIVALILGIKRKKRN